MSEALGERFRCDADIRMPLCGSCGILDLIEALTAALDAKNSYTRGHSDRVANLSSRLAKALGREPDEVEFVHMAGHLHDIGKIGVPDAIITKPGPLTPEETGCMNRHPVLGEDLVGRVAILRPFCPAVRHHHERWDGSGYPDGLFGADIPWEARVIGVADAYDAMTSDRPYRKGLSPREAVAEIERCAGGQFDPRVVEAFFRVLVDGRPGDD